MDDGITESSADDALFLERLDIYLEKSLDDLREFARREGRDFEQIRLKTAEWHSKYLFNSAHSGSRSQDSSSSAPALGAVAHIPEPLSSIDAFRTDLVNNTLIETSRTLELLEAVAGRHSLLLVVDPTTPDDVDDGFLGGTNTGREFWRGLRHGGSAGARSFKGYCRKAPGLQTDSSVSNSSTSNKQTPAGTLKNNLYSEMRSRLRQVTFQQALPACIFLDIGNRAISGVRNAEMKWTKPSKLSVYGVVLEGWPRHIEFKNPSRMSLNEISTLMGLLQENRLYFRSIRGGPSNDLSQSIDNPSVDDVSWALNEDNDRI